MVFVLDELVLGADTHVEGDVLVHSLKRLVGGWLDDLPDGVALEALFVGEADNFIVIVIT